MTNVRFPLDIQVDGVKVVGHLSLEFWERDLDRRYNLEALQNMDDL